MTDPRDLCRHYVPQHRRGCDAGRYVPADCPSCTRYDRDEEAILRGDPQDEDRQAKWAGEFEL